MAKKTLITIVLITACFLIPVAPACAEYESIYHYYIEEGLEAFYKEDFEDAIFYFKTAHAIDPNRPQPMQYLNLIKREQDGRLSQDGKKPTPRSIPTTPVGPHHRIVSRVTERSMYDILQSNPLQADEKTIQSVVERTLITVKADTEDVLTENDWNKVKIQSTTDVLARIDRLKGRTPENSILSLAETTDAANTLSSSNTGKADLQSPASKVTVPAPYLNTSIPSKVPTPGIIATAAESFKPISPLAQQSQHPYTITDSTGSVRRFYQNENFFLNDELWASHRTLTVEIEIGKGVVFVGKNIIRSLATTENLLEVARIDKNRLRIQAVRRGNTILYVWDDKGRWTFNIHCVYPFENVKEKKRDLNQELAPPFEIGYSSSWSTLHRGPSLDNMERQNLIYTNWIGVSGETPYGDFDGSINTYHFPESTEIVGQRVGLNKGRIGPFQDFALHGWDTFKSLSDLTMPGRYFRGGAIDSYAFHHKMAYSYFRGQDQTITIYSTDGSIRRQESSIEGFKLILNPDEESGQYAFNYAHAFGNGRLPNSKDQVYSLETKQKFKEFLILGELGYDEDEFATLIRGVKEQDDRKMSFNLRDVNPGYQTVYGQPTNSGQAGASFNYSLTPRDFRWDTFVDLYRNRAQPNDDHPNLVNFDFSTSYSRPIDDTSSWGTSFGYVNTPQELSPRQFIQQGASYAKNIKVGSTRYLSLSLSETVQWTRYDDSPSSDYDRMSLRAGMRYKLIKNLFYAMNYEYIVVHDVSNSDWSAPTALELSLDYNVPLADRLALGLNVTYRNEEQAVGDFSFLAGEDSTSNALSLTYHPSDRVSFYMDSQLRHVWPGNSTTSSAYYDWNLMIGMRSSWDMPFRWNPIGIIQGVVYKDYNGNSLQDSDEPGMTGIKIIAGKYETTTNENGEYSIQVKAKKVKVSLDLKTIPQGFVFSTALSRDVTIDHREAKRVNFGLTSRSGIYGVAFVDLNGNGKPDRGDKFIPNIVVRLDSGEITKTDYSGSFFFENLTPGKHKTKIDVATIPIRYTPMIKIENEVLLEEGITYVENIPLKETAPAEKPESK